MNGELLRTPSPPELQSVEDIIDILTAAGRVTTRNGVANDDVRARNVSEEPPYIVATSVRGAADKLTRLSAKVRQAAFRKICIGFTAT